MPILNILPIIQEQFPANWWDNYGYLNGDFSEEGLSKLSTALTETAERIFDELNSSILNGEYITLDPFIEQLKNIKELLHNVIVPYTDSESAQELINNSLNLNFTDALKSL